MKSVAVAELPEGTPGGKGVSLDPGIPGAATFAKPVDDIRKPEGEEGSIYRIDGPDSIAKPQTGDDSIDHSKAKPSYYGLGDPEPATKTKYPYRDEAPNAHNAAFVAEMWKLAGARVQVLKASEVRVAATRDEVLNGLDVKFQERAQRCTATLKRADMKNLRWIFSVDCGNGPKAVKIKAMPSKTGNVRQFSKLDLELSCSCPAWQWLGPEYHAKGESFILGKPRGTASTPNVRDPERDNRVCKHVAAALSGTRLWEIPKTRTQRIVKKAMRVRRALKEALSREMKRRLKSDANLHL